MALSFTDIINNNTQVNSSGYFKELMDSINAYIKKEYDSGRLSGSQYAEVYLSMMQTAIQQSVQYSLQKDLVQAQVNQAEQQTANLLIEANNLTKQGLLIDAQVTVLNKEASTKQYTLDSLLPAQLGLVNQQANTSLKQSQLYDAQVTAFNKKTLIEKADLLTKSWAVLSSTSGTAEALDTTGMFGVPIKSVLDNI